MIPSKISYTTIAKLYTSHFIEYFSWRTTSGAMYL